MFSMVAAVFAGLHLFVQKVGSVRGYNSSLLNTYSSALSSVLGFLVAGWFEGFSEISWTMVAFGVLNGVFYIIGANLRMDAMRCIDATILLPLHKFVSPLLALGIGVLFFSEILSSREWLGIALGVLVPLLLISRNEHTRQVNIQRGLILIVASALFAALGAAVSKEGTNLFTSVLLFAAVSNAFGAIAGSVQYRLRRKNSGSIAPDIHFADHKLLLLSLVSGVIQYVSYATFILAFAYGGTLAIVYTIHSLYILIPIVLAIIIYKEHWNVQKLIAIALSFAALWFMR